MTTTNFPHAPWPCVQYIYLYIYIFIFLETYSAKSAAAYLRSWSWRCLVMLTACIVLSLTTTNACCTGLSATSRESRASKFRNSAGLGGSAAFASCEFSQRNQHLTHQQWPAMHQISKRLPNTRRQWTVILKGSNFHLECRLACPWGRRLPRYTKIL